MGIKEARKIFSEKELYNLCSAEVHGQQDLHWSEFVDNELEEKFKQLSLSDQNEFEKQLKRAAKLFKDDFDELLDDEGINTEELREELHEAIVELTVKISNKLVDFLQEI